MWCELISTTLMRVSYKNNPTHTHYSIDCKTKYGATRQGSERTDGVVVTMTTPHWWHPDGYAPADDSYTNTGWGEISQTGKGGRRRKQ